MIELNLLTTWESYLESLNMRNGISFVVRLFFGLGTMAGEL